jgi:hypothetical protein
MGNFIPIARSVVGYPMFTLGITAAAAVAYDTTRRLWDTPDMHTRRQEIQAAVMRGGAMIGVGLIGGLIATGSIRPLSLVSIFSIATTGFMALDWGLPSLIGEASSALRQEYDETCTVEEEDNFPNARFMLHRTDSSDEEARQYLTPTGRVRIEEPPKDRDALLHAVLGESPPESEKWTRETVATRNDPLRRAQFDPRTSSIGDLSGIAGIDP